MSPVYPWGEDIRINVRAHDAGLAQRSDDVVHRDPSYVLAAGSEPYASPTILPSASMSMLSEAGFFGRPGIVMISPDSTTMNPAPAFK